MNTLCNQSIRYFNLKNRCMCALQLPSRNTIIEIIKNIRYILFLSYFDRRQVSYAGLTYKIGYFLNSVQIKLQKQIWKGLYFLCKNIDHSTDVVIDEIAIMKDNTRLCQGVTLGTKSFPLKEGDKSIKGIPWPPIIEGNVIIYASAKILGRITVGKNSIIGSNAWITSNLPPNSVIKQQ